MNGLDRWKVARKRLRILPRWAQVLFACRCARRAFPFYPGRPENLKIICRAVQIAETAAATAATALPDDAVEKMKTYYAAEGEATRAGDVSNSYYAAAAAYAAYLAATDNSARDIVAVSSQEAAEMSLLACETYHGASGANDPQVARLAKCIIGDLTALDELAVKNCWTDNDAVASSVLRSLRKKHEGKSVSMVLNEDTTGASVVITVNSESEMVRNELLSRICVSAQAIVGSFAHEPSRDGAASGGLTPSPANSSELLCETSYALLKELSQLHCKVNKTTWCALRTIHRGNATKYITELESRGLVLRDAKNLFAISPAGLEHLANHPRKTNAGIKSDS